MKTFLPVELELEQSGETYIAGVDEAGRGCFAGPLCIGFVILPRSAYQTLPESLKILDDSKKLKKDKREQLYRALKDITLFQCRVFISNRIIDQCGINPSTELAISYAIQRSIKAGFHPSAVLIDGNYKFHNLYRSYPQMMFQSIVKGDATVASIAAASIVAKVARDQRMHKLSRFFPAYHFHQHAGYGTKFHRDAIQKYGPSRLHRMSYNIMETKNGEQDKNLLEFQQ